MNRSVKGYFSQGYTLNIAIYSRARHVQIEHARISPRANGYVIEKFSAPWQADIAYQSNATQ